MSNDTFAVIKTGGKQYKVEQGQKLKIEKLPKKEGGVVNFSDVLLYKSGEIVEVGTPKVKGVKVSGKVAEQGRGDKVVVYKFKRRKRYRKKQGHRQPYTLVEITDIKKGTAGAKSATPKKTAKSGSKPKAAANKK